jgi:hypothetical protein
MAVRGPTIQPKEAWNGRPPRCTKTRRPLSEVKEIFVHWPGGPVSASAASTASQEFAPCPCMLPHDKEAHARATKLGLTVAPGLDTVTRGVTTVAQCKELLHGWQNFHMDVHGWCDGGYNVVGFQPRGQIDLTHVFWAFRGLLWVPAAQLHHNSNTFAFMMALGPNDKLDEETKARMRSLVRYIWQEVGHKVPVRPHSAVNDTTCPGPALTAYAHELNDISF